MDPIAGSNGLYNDAGAAKGIAGRGLTPIAGAVAEDGGRIAADRTLFASLGDRYTSPP